MSIPHVDVKAQYAPLIPELKDAFAQTLETGRFIFGPEVEAFEREAADYLGTRHSLGVANGTDALVIILDAMLVAMPGEPNACAASSMIGNPNARSSSIGAGRPKRCTGMSAFVRAVMRFSTSAGSRFRVTGSISANTGVAPRRAIDSAVA